MKDSGFRPAVLFVLPVLTSLAIALAHSASDPGVAQAQVTGGTSGTGGTGGTGGTTLTKADFETSIWIVNYDDAGVGEWVPLRGTDVDRYFSRARCECQAPVRFRVGVTAAGRQKVRQLTNATLALRVGDSSCYCTSPEGCRQQNCVNLSDQVIKLSELANNYVEFDTTARILFEAPGTGGGLGCKRVSGKQGVYMVAKIDADDYSDLTDGIIEVQLDGEAPPAPTGLTVRGGNEALSVSWNSIERSAVDDMQGYVLFCSRDDRPVFTSDKGEAAFNPPYETAQTLCPERPLQPPPPPQPLLVAAQTAETGTPLGPVGTVVPPPTPFVERRKTFACTDLLTTQTGARLFRLQNHITYLVGIASVDDRGNISEISEVTAQQPIPTVDFYRDYRADGGAAEGGFCAVAPSGRAGAWLVVGVLAAGLALVWRRRRR